MTAVVLALWLAIAVYLLGRGLAYLIALSAAAPSWQWVVDTRMWLLLAPFLLPVAFYFYRADPSALVIVVLAFAMLIGWSSLYVFRNLLSEMQDDLQRADRRSHVAGAALVVVLIAVVLWGLR
ncbi:hypothetical protein [uncultured Tateyamaria sp.]|uniref:hypothetical protein n=1 Tax=Tateyamaria sp. 1078 TaxID=3417464 RepID=UPI00261E782A|nr:hypothetical protein [uncultured Tateyamaria sp.]